MRAILTYHSVDDSGSAISISREEFRGHCRFLASGGVRVVTLAGLLALPDETPAVALTFDDGFSNFWSDAAPELEERGLSATVFAVSGHVGARNDWGGRSAPGIPDLPLMGWEQLGRLAERGFEIGAHTRSHPNLRGLSVQRLEDEIAGGAADIESSLGIRPSAFAYPYGAVDTGAADVARQHFQASCTTRLRGLRPSDDRALLPRLDMFYFRSPGALESWGSAVFALRLWVRARGREVRSLLEPATALARHRT